MAGGVGNTILLIPIMVTSTLKGSPGQPFTDGDTTYLTLVQPEDAVLTNVWAITVPQPVVQLLKPVALPEIADAVHV